MNEEQERYQRYLCTREWATKRDAVRRRCKGICERCNHNRMDHCHHLTYIRKYNERLEDLQGVCAGCHQYIHNKRKRDPLLDVPLRLFGKTIRSFYLAGKISGSSGQWRDEITGSKESKPKYDPMITIPYYLDEIDDEVPFIKCPVHKRFLDYTGPFYRIASGGHGPCEGSHQCIDWSAGDNERSEILNEYLTIKNLCLEQIKNADLLFAWIDSREAFATLAEIGYAVGLGKTVVIATPNVDHELWFPSLMGDRILLADSPLDAWNSLWRHDGEPSSIDLVWDGRSTETDSIECPDWQHCECVFCAVEEYTRSGGFTFDKDWDEHDEWESHYEFIIDQYINDPDAPEEEEFPGGFHFSSFCLPIEIGATA